MAEHEDTFRLRVLKALTAHLETISVTGGFKHDMAGKVFRGRDWFGEGDPIPMLSILEQVQQPEQEVRGHVSKGDWLLTIQGFVDDDRNNPTDPAHHLMGDVKRSLAQMINGSKVPGQRRDFLGLGPGAGNGNEVTGISFGAGVVRPPEEFVSTQAHFWLEVTVSLVENLLTPYA